MRTSTYCDCCRREVASVATEMFSSVGLLAAVQFRARRGYFCRDCVKSFFWRTTAQNLTLGLLRIFGPLAGPVLVLANVFPFIGSLRVAKPAADAQSPLVDEAVMSRAAQIASAVVEDIERESGNLHESAVRFADKAGLSPAQLIRALHIMVQAQEPPVGGPGFEVLVNHLPRID
jgi:hypothetical protein